MDLKMEVYTPYLELVGILEVYRSVIWEEKAFGAGSFSVDSLITDESKTLLVPGNIIWIFDNYAGVIEYVQEQSGKNGPYITVKGPNLTGILGQRILWGQYNLAGTAPAIMHNLVSDCCISPTRGNTEARKIPGLVSLTPAAGGDAIRAQKTGSTLLEALEELGAAYGVAFGVRFNAEIPRMEFWTRWGQNRSVNQTTHDPVFYSTELDDVLSSEYSYNAQDYRNVALVAGEGEGGDRVTVTVNADVAPTPIPPTPVTKYIITLSVDPAGGGTVTGAGQYQEGAVVTLSATINDGYTFNGWKENGALVSTDNPYAFTAISDRAFVAAFAEKPAFRLPAGYTEVEYISNPNLGYIYTEFSQSYSPFGGCIITAKLDLTDASLTSSTAGGIFGYSQAYRYNSSSSFQDQVLCGLGLRSKATIEPYYAYKVGSSVSIPDGIHEIVFDNNEYKLYLDGVQVATFAITYAAKRKQGFEIFAIHQRMYTGTNLTYNKEFKQIINFKLYSFTKRSSTGATQIDFVPCVNADGTAGLFDLISETFVKSALDDHPFTAGPAV